MDRFGDHALVCPCKGDRTIRHNALRNIAYEESSLAGMQPVKDELGLLPQRPREDGLKSGGQRRPADARRLLAIHP